MSRSSRAYQKQLARKKQDWKWVKISFAALLVVLALLFSKLWYDGIIFFATEEAIINAHVEKVSYTPERLNTWYRTVHYSYRFNDSTYTGMEKISFSKYFCSVGDTIEIEVLKRKPEVSRISVE